MVSVIVPVYNVEQYLKKCLDSIICQTFKDLEIILVDDGSTDSSGAICDNYQKVDSRIKVVHKKNGGLADARNVGFSISTGDYISFIDSDDWVDKYFIETLYTCCIDNNAQMAVCRIYDRYSEDEVLEEYEPFTECWTGKEAVINRITQEKKYCIVTSALNKLYKRELIQGYSFPVSRYYEDIVYTTRALLDSDRVVYTNCALYNYRRNRPGSIMTEGLNPRVVTDELPLMSERNRIIREEGLTDIADLVDRNYCIRAIEINRQIINSKDISNKEKLVEICQQHYRDVYHRCSKKYFHGADKVKIIMYQLNPKLCAKVLNLIYRK